MIVRPPFIVTLACLALLLGGCGAGDRQSLTLETEDSGYQQGKQLQREGRDPEALTVFLKVIDRRGDQNSAESHFEAGNLFLHNAKDPVEAIHHLRRYLALPHDPKQTKFVEGLIDSARREFAASLPGRLLDDQSAWLGLRDEADRLRKQNNELKAENDSLRNGSIRPVIRVSRASTDPIELPPARTEAPPIGPAPPYTPPSQASSPFVGFGTPRTTSAPPNNAAPANPTAPGRAGTTSPPANAPARRKHVIASGDSLFSLSRKYHVAVDAILAANRDILPNINTPLRIGTELRIP